MVHEQQEFVVAVLLQEARRPGQQFLQVLSLRFLFSTFGIVVVLINSLLLYLLSVLMENILIDGVLPIILGGVVVGMVGAGVDAMLGADYPMLDRDYKERNGLA